MSRITVKVIYADGSTNIETFLQYKATPELTVAFLNKQAAGVGYSHRYELIK